MHQDLRTLYELQEADDKVAALETRIREIPNEIAKLEGQLRAAEQEYSVATERLEDANKKRRRLEMDVDANRESLARFQTQLYSVKSNREYTAMLGQIEDLKKKSSDLEDMILLLLEEAESLEKEVARLEGCAKEEKARVEKEIASLRESLEQAKSSVVEGRRARDQVAQRMPSQLLKRYDRIRDVRNGAAVVCVENSVCEGCKRRLPPQEFIEIKRNERVRTCEGCGRILVYVGENHNGDEDTGGGGP